MSDKDLPQIKTYQGDVAHALEEEKHSLNTIRAAELAKNGGALTDPEKKRIYSNIFFLIAGIIFLIGGGVGGYLTYNKYKEVTAVPTIITPTNRFIPIDEEKVLYVTGLTRESFINAVLDERGMPLVPGSIKQLQWKKAGAMGQLQPVTEFFLILNAGTPDNFVRNLSRDYMIGMIGEDNAETFIILKTDSYENAFSGMLAWEENMPRDILPLFAPEVLPSATGTPAFTDLTIKNKDVRVLQDENGVGVLFYTFYNQLYIVFAQSEGALTSIIQRLDNASLRR
ncbi:MAG: hypothetical protein WD874_01015 [Parcubacteria group bacterium]